MKSRFFLHLMYYTHDVIIVRILEKTDFPPRNLYKNTLCHIGGIRAGIKRHYSWTKYKQKVEWVVGIGANTLLLPMANNQGTWEKETSCGEYPFPPKALSLNCPQCH